MDQAKKLTRGGVALFAAVALLIAGVASLALAPQKAWAGSITQTAATDKTATVAWEDPYQGSSYGTTVGYTLSWGKDSSSATNKVSLPASQTSYTLTNLKPGTEYFVKVEYTYTTKYSAAPRSGSVGSSFDVATRVVAPTGIKQVKWWYWAKSVEFTWDRQDAADQVQYQVMRTGKSKPVVSKTERYPSTSFTCNKVKNDAVYTVQMRVHDKWGWSAWSKKAYLFTQPMVKEKKTKVSGKKLTVSWNKVKGATSYTVYASTKEKKGYKKIKTVKASKSSLTFKKIGNAKISPKKTYYVYVVANKKVGKTTYTSGKLYTYKVKGSKGSLRWTF